MLNTVTFSNGQFLKVLSLKVDLFYSSSTMIVNRSAITKQAFVNTVLCHFPYTIHWQCFVTRASLQSVEFGKIELAIILLKVT